jgi:hypothetical protein
MIIYYILSTCVENQGSPHGKTTPSTIGTYMAHHRFDEFDVFQSMELIPVWGIYIIGAGFVAGCKAAWMDGKGSLRGTGNTGLRQSSVLGGLEMLPIGL